MPTPNEDRTPEELAERERRAAENRARYPKFTAFVDGIRQWDPMCKVSKVYPEACE